MRWDRLREMTREELGWRTRAALRANAHRLAAQLRAPRWNRRALGRIVARDVRRDIDRASSAGHWQDVHAALFDRLRHRPTRFVLDPASRPRLREAVLTLNTAAAGEARARADRVVRGQYDLLGYRGLRFTTARHRVDWHFDPVWGRHAPRVFYTRVPYLDPAIGDHKIIWELNRHQHWLTLGRAAWLTDEEVYAATAIGELYDWLDANPPLVGINWASMLEIGFRAISWTWMLHCLLGLEDRDRGPGTEDRGLGTGGSESRIPNPLDRPWLVDMFVGLGRQLTHVEQNLSYYFSPNTHLTGEALALYVAGVALPELAGAERWAAIGRRILLDEIDRQILGDGGHAERSSHYQRYTLEFYVLALLTARVAGDSDAATRFGEAAGRLAEFTRLMADDRGRLPLIGDDDGGMLWPMTGRACSDVRDALATAAVVLERPALAPWGLTEETIWVAGPAGTDRDPQLADASAITLHSRTLEDTGYVIMRDADGSHAVFDAAAHGYLNAGHAHADALAVTLTLDGQPLLIDPGTSTYTMDAALRDGLRSSASHNTLTLDGRSQSTPAGPFHWHTRADAALQLWRQNEAFDYAEGTHDGYAPLRHHRAVVRTARSGWLIVDGVDGRGHHVASAHWHVAPEWRLESDGRRIRAVHADGADAYLLHDGGEATVFRGDRDTGLGWYAPAYGTLHPSSTVRVTVAGDAPLHMVTWIAAGAAWPAPELRRVTVDGDGDLATIAAAVTADGRRALFLVRLGGAALHAARVCRVAEFDTDARLLHARSDGDRLVCLDVADATHVVARHQGWISIEAEGPLRDLHVAVDEGVVDLRGSIPPMAVHVRGLAPSHRLRLNGRDFMSTWPAGTGVRVLPSDWHVATPTQPVPAQAFGV